MNLKAIQRKHDDYPDNEEFGKNFKTGVYLCLLSAVSIVTLSVFTIISIVNWFRS